MMQHEHSTVVGVFDDSDKARDSIQALKDSGFAAQDIGILMKDRGDAKDMAEETGTRAGEGAATRLIGGGILGGLAGWLVGIGALAIPGVGPFIAAGAFGTALAGAGIGAGIGAIAGALVGMGIPKEEAEFYEDEVRQGRTLVTVTARDRYSEARDILRQYGAYDVHDRTGADTGRMSTMGTTTGAGTYGSSTMGTSRWEDVMPEYRNRWQQRYGNMGGSYRWEDYEPSYHYAYDMYNRPEYTNRSWNEVEPEFRRDWQNRYHDKPWDRFGEAIHDAWDNLTHHGEHDYRGDTTTRGGLMEDRFEIVGGENYGPHEHKWVGDRCEICGATRRYRRAA